MAIKRKIKNAIITIFPSLWYSRVRKDYYRLNIVNDLSIVPKLEQPYNFAGVYVTMPDKPDNVHVPEPVFIPEKYNRHPVAISQYGLSSWGFYCGTGDEKYLRNAEAVGKWLLENQDQDTGLWYYWFDYIHKPTGTELKQPWASAMAQGEAASLLVRLWTLTKDDKYLSAARRAFDKFDVTVEDGGLQARYDDHVFYEEYPTIPHSYTLNGMIYSLFGLYDLATATNDEKIRRLFDQGVDSVAQMLPLYNDRFCSCYDLTYINTHNKVQNEKYHLIHIKQLQCLNHIAKNDVFDIYIKKWGRVAGCHFR